MRGASKRVDMLFYMLFYSGYSQRLPENVLTPVTATYEEKLNGNGAGKRVVEHWIQLISALRYPKSVSFVEQGHQYVAQIPNALQAPL